MSQTYWFITNLLQPFTLLMLGLGLLIFWPQPATAPRRRWMKLWYALFYLYCTPLAAYSVTHWLEQPFPRQFDGQTPVDAIVVLGAGIFRSDGDPGIYRLDDYGLRRCQRAAEFYRSVPSAVVVASGGVPHNLKDLPAVGAVMADALKEMGVDERNLIVESQSHTTEQNAEFSAPLLREKGCSKIAVVSTATHLRRSQRLFERHGFEVIPVGCLYRTDEFEWNAFAFLPREKAIERQHESLHELLGMVYLFVRGKW